MSESEILTKLRPELADALGLENMEIAPEQRLVADLGAESIDLVDLTFRIEKTFDIRIPEGELFEDSNRAVDTLTVANVADYIRTRIEAA